MTTSEESIEQAYVRYRTEVYRFLLRLTRDHHEAEDLTQEAFADAAAAVSRAAAPKSMRGWLFAVAARRAVDEHRRRERAARVVDMLIASSGADAADGCGDAEAAFRKLPPEQRQIVALKIVEGRTHGEIARMLGCNEAACKMQLSRALRRLRNELRATP